jgi:hypothetical protein
VLIIGIDLDNTIVQYDQIIHNLAVKRGLIPKNTQPNKTVIRNICRSQGHDHFWTDIQGYVYGEGMKDARPFPGVIDFLQSCRNRDILVHIISHRSEKPYAGGDVNLHESALKWLVQERITGFPGAMIPEERIFFELTKEEKHARIHATGCSLFIDDLAEFLVSDLFPREVKAILFDPYDIYPNHPAYFRLRSWDHLPDLLPIV